MKLQLKLKPKFALRLKGKAVPPPSQFPPLSPALREWLNGKSTPGPYLGEIDMSAVPSVGGPLKCYWIGSSEWMGTLWPNDGRHVSRAQDAWPDRILEAFNNMKLYGTVEAPKPKLRFKQPEGKPVFRLKLKLKEPTAKQEGMPDTKGDSSHTGDSVPSVVTSGNERPSGGLSLKTPASPVGSKLKLKPKEITEDFLDGMSEPKGIENHPLVLAKKAKLSLKLKPKLRLKPKSKLQLKRK